MEQKAWIRKQSGMTTAGQTESCCMERGLEKSEIEIREKNGVTYLAFPALSPQALIRAVPALFCYFYAICLNPSSSIFFAALISLS